MRTVARAFTLLKKKEKTRRGRGRCESGDSVDTLSSEGSGGAMSIVQQQRQSVVGSALRASNSLVHHDDEA